MRRVLCLALALATACAEEAPLTPGPGVDAGALPGFGKSDDKDEAADRVRAALALNK